MPIIRDPVFLKFPQGRTATADNVFRKLCLSGSEGGEEEEQGK